MTNKDALHILKSIKNRSVNSFAIDALDVAINALEKPRTGKWVLGEELNSQGIIPPRKTDCRHFKGDTRKFWDAVTYCSECYGEAYDDTDYGEQLFEYCPYCGSHMENGGEDD